MIIFSRVATKHNVLVPGGRVTVACTIAIPRAKRVQNHCKPFQTVQRQPRGHHACPLHSGSDFQKSNLVRAPTRVLNLKSCKKVTHIVTFSGRVRDLMKLTHLLDWSNSKQCNFDLKDTLRKKCTTYTCAKSSQESIGELFIA